MHQVLLCEIEVMCIQVHVGVCMQVGLSATIVNCIIKHECGQRIEVFVSDHLTEDTAEIHQCYLI